MHSCFQFRVQRGRRHANRQGAVLVEFALVLPIMLFLFSASLEIVRVLMLQQTTDTAAYEAARVAMIPGATSLEAVAEANELLRIADLSETTVTIHPRIISEETAFVTVEVTAPVASNSWIAPQFLTDFVVRSEVMLMAERSPIVRLTGLPELKAKKIKMKKEKGGKAGL